MPKGSARTSQKERRTGQVLKQQFIAVLEYLIACGYQKATIHPGTYLNLIEY